MEGKTMIFICVKWKVKPEHAEAGPQITHEFTVATRAEPGNIFFEWSRSVDDPTTYVLIEAFAEDAAEAHVTSAHFRKAQEELPAYLPETPKVRNIVMPGDHWDELGEFRVEA